MNTFFFQFAVSTKIDQSFPQSDDCVSTFVFPSGRGDISCLSKTTGRKEILFDLYILMLKPILRQKKMAFEFNWGSQPFYQVGILHMVGNQTAGTHQQASDYRAQQGRMGMGLEKGRLGEQTFKGTWIIFWWQHWDLPNHHAIKNSILHS